MHRRTVSEAGEQPSPRSSRAPSFSSERPTLAGSVTFQMPSLVRPPPAYIAASVASQLVTDHHNAQFRDDHDQESALEAPLLTNAIFSEQALSLLNSFLDHLLFAILSTARSPSLAAIRPAITEVLKPRLARGATATADDELQSLLGGEEEEFPEPLSPAPETWDVEKVWKRTRLRIMVYTRLGEMEDEDEERHVQQERALSMDDSDDDDSALVSWASAIFLTSIVEYVAEQTLLVSGQASYNRMAAKLRKAARMRENGEQDPLERIVVEEYDVEKIALNSALGRLWRTWRKRVRAPITPLGVRSRTSYNSLHSRQMSLDTIERFGMSSSSMREVPEHEPTETEIAANIPLPISDNDVAEIEVPGLVRPFDEEEEDSSGAETPVARPQRPRSVIMLSPAMMFRKRKARERPLSMPPPAPRSFSIPAQSELQDSTDSGEAFETPMERVSDDESYIMDEQQESMHGEHRGNDSENDADMVAFAASTGMGFGMTTPTKSTFDKEEEDDTFGTPTEFAYSSPARVMPAKRMSIGKHGPPGVIRTRSIPSQRSSPASTPVEPTSLGPTSFLEDAHSDDDLSGPEAIGVAHTSNIPVPVMASPPLDLGEFPTVPAERKSDHQGFVELAPRHVVTPPVRETPSPLDRAFQPESASQRKEMSKEKAAQRKETAPQKTLGPMLAALQEIDDIPNSPPRGVPIRKPVEPQRTASNGSPKNYGTIRARDSPVPVAERPVPAKRPSMESPPLSRTIAGDGGYVEKSTLKRVSSTSTGRSVSTSILNTGRDSESSLSRPRGLSHRMSEEDRQREFDSLVKSEDTVKFTLTPQAMRDMDEPSLRKVDPPRPTTASVTVYPRVSADKDNQFGSPPNPSRSTSRSNGRTASPAGAVSHHSFGKPLAREPRIQADSMQDFADFIRSTGPSPGAERPVKPFVSLSNSPMQSPNPSSTAVSTIGRKISTRQISNHSSHSKSNSHAGDGPSAKPRIHMEPRSPAGQRSGNDDLIDFIRQGPPGPNGVRIPRAVAPFRSTVDSDQFDRMLDDSGNIESTFSSQVSSNSKHSANSRTGLLPPASTVQPAYSNIPQKLSGSLSSPEPQVQRTRRRIKDPYAIDLSDDEDDDLLTALPSSAREPREESLADFLNSAQPPSPSNPPPFHLSEATIAAARARAANSANPANNSRNGSSRGQPSSQSPGPSQTHKPRLHARGAGVREPTLAKSSTSDLADFLRTSGPPEPPPARPEPVKEQKRSTSRFWRKKTEVA